MTKNLLYLFFIIVISPLLVVYIFHYNDSFIEEVIQVPVFHKKFIEPPNPFIATSTDTMVLLNTPFVSEAPDGIWTGPWKNACEEASIAMVENFYKGVFVADKNETKEFMKSLFSLQDEVYGSNANSDAKRSNYLIEQKASFSGVIIENPTIEQIKEEIRGGRPVIAFHRGFDLHNENIPFLPTGSSFHSTVVIGYDDSKNIFLVNDPGDKEIDEPHHYEYNLYMLSLRDYNYANNKADGPARVIFTSS